MSSNAYLTPNDLYCSSIFGRGVYRWDGNLVNDPLATAGSKEDRSPLLVNTYTDERFFVRRFEGDGSVINKYRRFILDPPPRDILLWPSDMVVLEKEQETRFNRFVQQEYTDNPMPKNQWKGSKALLFPYDAAPSVTRMERHLSAIRELGWKSKEARGLAVELAFALERLNRAGYAYFDMHFSRLFTRVGGELYLDFSNLVYRIEDLQDSDTEPMRSPNVGEYPLEFAEPAYAQGKTTSFDMRTQNFSLASMLFYVLLGRYAYDGSMVEYLPDDSLMNHYHKVETFLEAPVFIFDDDDHDNALGQNDRAGRRTQELWDDLPNDLKILFKKALCQQNAERSVESSSPAPLAWLRRFNELGWTNT